MSQYQRASTIPLLNDTYLIGLIMAPVIIFLAGTIALTALAWSGPDDVDFYRKKARLAAERLDWQSSIFAMETLMTIEPSNRSLQWDLAMAYKKSGATDLFDLSRTEMAPLDRPGFGPAHRFTAGQILEKLEQAPPADPSVQESMLKQSITHLRHSLVDQPGHAEGAERLADLLLALEDYSGAAQVMNTVPVASMTSSMKIRMAWATNRENPNKGLETVNSLASALESTATKADALDTVRRAHADSCELRGNIPASASIWIQLFEASRAEFRKTEARRHLARLHTRRADEFFNRVPRDYSGMAEAIFLGLSINPAEPSLLERLVKLANLSEIPLESPDDSGIRAKAQIRLNEMLAQGVAPSLLHLLLGVEYHKARRQDMARLHFELSHRADPLSMDIANNLAWYMAHTTPRDPEKALILINAALLRLPEKANYLETRGQILALLGRHTEAITDLEKATRLMGSTRAIHTTLADCYTRLGETELAKRHQSLANQKNIRPKTPVQ